MKPINAFLDFCRAQVRSVMHVIAVALNKLTGGKITPDMVTITGLIAHVPIAILIATSHYYWAGFLLIIFGLFDALDGALARVQGTTSAHGMFLDSVTDRMKEIIIYCGILFYLADLGTNTIALVALVAALGISVLTSYLNAWGEVVLAHHTKKANHQINKTFRSGLLGFEIRTTLLIIGLFTNQLVFIIYIILLLGSVTVVQRIQNVRQHLQHV